MITGDLEYHRPSRSTDAVKVYGDLSAEGKSPVFYSGGTEIIATLREGSLTAGAIIDLKDVPECRELGVSGEWVTIGSAVTLNEVIEEGAFPLLGAVGKGFLDHTNRNKVTVGGNICSKLPYKEMSLPFLVTQSEALLAGPNGMRRVPFLDVFQGELDLSDGEILLQIAVKREDTALPWACVRKTRQAKVAYPLASVVAVRKGHDVRMAVTGVCDFPFQCAAAGNGSCHLPAEPRTDIDGSGEYRQVVLDKLTREMLGRLEVG